MDYNCILLTDSRFISYAVSELKERLGVTGRLKTMALGKGIYLARLDDDSPEALAQLRSLTFSYGILPLVGVMDSQATIEEMTEGVGQCVAKGEPFRIEVVSLGAKRGESAKDTEVKLGLASEVAGFTVSLKDPKRIVYIIVGEGITAIGSALATDLEDMTIDHFRLENRDQDILNRAEVKMKEAFDVFKLNDERIGSCLDIGASPGGWTNFMVKRGAKVVAIDKGALEYDRLATKDVKTIENLTDYSEGSAVLHIKMNLSGTEKLPFKVAGFDLLAVDTNTDYRESSKVANSLAAYLKPGGFLIMTLKLPKMSDAGRIYLVKDALSANYKVERIKKLHHNRMELTLFALRL
jgi:23S rRNA (cytidine2498-2'-O)-methyltransferase